MVVFVKKCEPPRHRELRGFTEKKPDNRLFGQGSVEIYTKQLGIDLYFVRAETTIGSYVHLLIIDIAVPTS